MCRLSVETVWPHNTWTVKRDLSHARLVDNWDQPSSAAEQSFLEGAGGAQIVRDPLSHDVLGLVEITASRHLLIVQLCWPSSPGGLGLWISA